MRPQLNLRLTPEHFAEVKKRAASERRRPSDWVRLLIEDAIGRTAGNVGKATRPAAKKSRSA